MTPARRAWLLLAFQLPARPTAVRMRVWRQLQRLGAMPLKGGAYVLPHTPQARRDLESLRADISARKGHAALFAADPVDPAVAADLARRFRRPR